MSAVVQLREKKYEICLTKGICDIRGSVPSGLVETKGLSFVSETILHSIFIRNIQNHRAVLHTFFFPQAKMRKIIPDSDSEATARKLGKILQKSEAVQDAQALLLQAHKHADQLFNPAGGAPCSD